LVRSFFSYLINNTERLYQNFFDYIPETFPYLSFYFFPEKFFSNNFFFQFLNYLLGNFKGNISAADRVEVSSSANIQGDLRAPKLVVAEGATLIGNFNISPETFKNKGAVPATPAPTFVKK